MTILTPNSPGGDAPDEDLSLLTILEAAQKLSVGRTKVYSLMDDGELEEVYVGRCHRITRDSIDDYIRRHRRRRPPTE